MLKLNEEKIVNFLVSFIVLFWPLLLWLMFHHSIGYIPEIDSSNLGRIIGVDMIFYSINRYWDILFWWSMIALYLFGSMIDNHNKKLISSKVYNTPFTVLFILSSIFFLIDPVFIFLVFLLITKIWVFIKTPSIIKLC